MTLQDLESFAWAESIDMDEALTQVTAAFYFRGMREAGSSRVLFPPDDLLELLTGEEFTMEEVDA